jgi:hypothetical protein
MYPGKIAAAAKSKAASSVAPEKGTGTPTRGRSVSVGEEGAAQGATPAPPPPPAADDGTRIFKVGGHAANDAREVMCLKSCATDTRVFLVTAVSELQAVDPDYEEKLKL